MESSAVKFRPVRAPTNIFRGLFHNDHIETPDRKFFEQINNCLVDNS